MSVDVVYQGLAIARSAGLRVENNQVFLEMDGPMPVATKVTIAHQEHMMEGKVVRVQEGVGAGMAVVPQGGGPLPAWIHNVKPPVVQTVEIEAEPEPEATPTAPVAEVAPVAPAAPVAEAAPVAMAPAAATAPSVPKSSPVEPTMLAMPIPSDGEEEAAASSVTPAPYEATQELSIPSLEEELRSEGDPKARRSKKKRR